MLANDNHETTQGVVPVRRELGSRTAVIVGIYATEQRRALPERTSTDLAPESVLGALADAGLTTGDVDGVAVDWPGPTGQIGYTTSWARIFGHPINYMTDSVQDNAGPQGVMKAAAALTVGLCEVLVLGGGRAGRPIGPVSSGTTTGGGFEFMNRYGAHVMPQFALVAQRHMHEFGTTPRQLAEVAATIRNNSAENPEAVMHGKGPTPPTTSSPPASSPPRYTCSTAPSSRKAVPLSS
jgi:acetyl-CoA acetyltransferase